MLPRETSDTTDNRFRNIAKPLTSNAYPADISLLIPINEEPEPISTFPLIETSAPNKARRTTYKLPFRDKSEPTAKLPLNDASPITLSLLPRETSDTTDNWLRNIAKPLTSNAYPADISLLIATEEEPEPISTLPFIETSAPNKARLTTYKLPFRDKSEPTAKLPLNDASPTTVSRLPRETSDTTDNRFRNIAKPLTSNAYPADISLLIATNEEPNPISKFPFIETSAPNKARLTTYKLPFRDKSEPTAKLPLNDASPITLSLLPRETSDTTDNRFRNIAKPLTSSAYPADISLLIATNEEPEPISTLPFIETSAPNKARRTTYKFPFRDKSEPTTKFPLKDESPFT